MWIKSETGSTEPREDNWVAIDWELEDLVRKDDINRLDEA